MSYQVVIPSHAQVGTATSQFGIRDGVRQGQHPAAIEPVRAQCSFRRLSFVTTFFCSDPNTLGAADRVVSGRFGEDRPDRQVAAD